MKKKTKDARLIWQDKQTNFTKSPHQSGQDRTRIILYGLQDICPDLYVHCVFFQ